MDKRTVAVIMPAYNTEKYIAPAIESVLCQTYEDIILVIVDDASTDHTWSIIKKYTDPRIYAIKNEKNCGVSHARNVALQFVYENFSDKVGYIAFVDSDDICLPQRIEKLLKALPDDNSFVADNSREMNGDKLSGSLLQLRYGIYTSDPIVAHNLKDLSKKDLLLYTFHCLVPINIIKSNKIYFNENFSFAEDFHFLLQLIRSGATFIMIPQTYYIYRVRSDSLAHGKNYLSSIAPVIEDCLDKGDFSVDDTRILTNLYKRNLKERHYREIIFSVRKKLFFKTLILSFKHPLSFLLVLYRALIRLWYKIKYKIRRFFGVDYESA